MLRSRACRLFHSTTCPTRRPPPLTAAYPPRVSGLLTVQRFRCSTYKVEKAVEECPQIVFRCLLLSSFLVFFWAALLYGRLPASAFLYQ